jgi:hypothetical protein
MSWLLTRWSYHSIDLQAVVEGPLEHAAAFAGLNVHDHLRKAAVGYVHQTCQVAAIAMQVCQSNMTRMGVTCSCRRRLLPVTSTKVWGQRMVGTHFSAAFLCSVLASLSAYRKSPVGMPRMPGAPWSLHPVKVDVLL